MVNNKTFKKARRLKEMEFFNGGEEAKVFGWSLFDTPEAQIN